MLFKIMTVVNVVGRFEDIHIAKTKEIKEKRLAICAECEHVRDLMNRGWINYCNVCGCMLNTKARMRSSSCPLEKW